MRVRRDGGALDPIVGELSEATPNPQPPGPPPPSPPLLYATALYGLRAIIIPKWRGVHAAAVYEKQQHMFNKFAWRFSFFHPPRGAGVGAEC